MTTRGAPEYTELVLQADDIHVTDIEEIRGTKIGRKVLFLNLVADYLRVIIATLNVIYGNRKTLGLWMHSGDGRQQVGRERRDAALARQVIADKSNLADLRMFFHAAILCFLWRSAVSINLILQLGRQAGNEVDLEGS